MDPRFTEAINQALEKAEKLASKLLHTPRILRFVAML